MTAEETKDGRPGGLPMNEAVPSSPTVGIPDALLAAIGAANSHGETLRCGDYVAIWDEGEFPYGKPDKCPFCKEPQNYTELWYNGPGSPPSYAVMCGHCGAQGPTSSGNARGDHYGARVDAVRLWNTAQGIEAGTARCAARKPGRLRCAHPPSWRAIMTEPEQWVVELLRKVIPAWWKDEGDYAEEYESNDAAMLIQRAFEERERELREAGKALLAHIGPRDSRVYRTDPAVRRFEAALATRQDAPVTENSDDH